MLAEVGSAAVNGFEGDSVDVEVSAGCGDGIIVTSSHALPMGRSKEGRMCQ